MFPCELRKWPKTTSASGAHLQLCPMQIRCNVPKKSPLGVCFFIKTETSRLAGSFIFIYINLKLTVKVKKFLPCLRRYFFFRWDFWR